MIVQAWGQKLNPDLVPSDRPLVLRDGLRLGQVKHRGQNTLNTANKLSIYQLSSVVPVWEDDTLRCSSCCWDAT